MGLHSFDKMDYSCLPREESCSAPNYGKYSSDGWFICQPFIPNGAISLCRWSLVWLDWILPNKKICRSLLYVVKLTSQTGDQPYSDTSACSECSLVNVTKPICNSVLTFNHTKVMFPAWSELKIIATKCQLAKDLKMFSNIYLQLNKSKTNQSII